MEETKKFMNKIAFLDDMKRKELLPPEEILSMLDIQDSHRILDIGAGSGFLTIPAAGMVREEVFALDIDPRMLQVIKAKAEEGNIDNIKLLQADIENIPLPAKSIDVVLASLILHEVKSLSRVLKQIGSLLKTGGQLLCLEYEKEERFVQGPPMSIRIKSSQLEEELAKAGFRVTQKRFPQEAIYIIVAEKLEDESIL